MFRRLVVFPERRTVRMAEHICSVHGGVLPVPENFGENKVGGATLNFGANFTEIRGERPADQ